MNNVNSDVQTKSKVYLNYIEGSKVKKYEFNLNDPMEIRQYNQALKLDDDKRNTYLLLLAKKKLNSSKELLDNTNSKHTILHPNKLVDKRYDLSHNVYVQEEEKKELEEIRKNKARLAKERMTATDERKKEIDEEVEDLEKRERIIEKNLEEEYEEDYKQPTLKSSSKNQNSDVNKDIYKLLKTIDKKYGSKLTEIAKRLENAENTKAIVDEMKEEMRKFKEHIVENDRFLVAETLSVIEEKAKINSIKKLLEEKIKGSDEKIKKLARDKYSQLSDVNKRIFVNSLSDNPRTEEDITTALEKTSKGNYSTLYTVLNNNPFTKPMIPLFQRYWTQINKTQLISDIIKYFSVPSKLEFLAKNWKSFMKAETESKILKTNSKNANLIWKYNIETKTLYIIGGFNDANFAKLKTEFNKINKQITTIRDEYIKAYGSDEFDFDIQYQAIYPKDPAEYNGVNKYKAWKTIVDDNDFDIQTDKTKTKPGFAVILSCNYDGAVSIFMNGVALTTKGFSFAPTILPITILGKKIDIDNPIASLDELPLGPAAEINEEEEIDDVDMLIEEKEKKEMKEEEEEEEDDEDGAEGISENDYQLIKSELQTIKSLLFTIIYKMNKKDKDKYNKKNNNKSGGYDWLFN